MLLHFKQPSMVEAGAEEVLALLLEAGAPAGLPVEGGATALHAAAEAGSLAAVLQLLQVSRWIWL